MFKTRIRIMKRIIQFFQLIIKKPDANKELFSYFLIVYSDLFEYVGEYIWEYVQVPLDFIDFICDMYEVPQETREQNIKKYAKMFEIEDKLNDTIESFSHGMKQKVALISALAHDPKVLVMDEPFVGLDPKAVFDVKEIMNEMVKEGKIIFFSTHILDVAEKLCSRVAIIKKGELVKVGSMEEIKGDQSLEKVFLELEG